MAKIKAPQIADLDTAKTTTGTFADARIAESNVTQHEAAIDHDALTNFVANEHIDHTSVTLTAGTGISGGGDISANRTFNVDGVLEDLNTLGAASADSEMIVATGAGAFAYETGATLRTSIGVDAAGTDNSTDVTLAGTPNYLTLSSQEITLAKLDITDDTNFVAGTGLTLATNTVNVNGVLEDLDTLGANSADSEFLVGTGAGALAWETGATARTSLGVDAAGTDNSTDVTLAGTPNYLTLSGQAITLTKLDVSDDTNLVGGSGITLSTNTLDLDINSLSVATIAAGDFLPFWDITATATNKKITFANLEGTLAIANLSDESNYLLADGSRALSGNWDAGSFSITTSNLIVDTTAGININPGSDTDTDLITVGVTGGPKLSWDESSDAFFFTGSGIVHTSDGNGDLSHTIAGATISSQLELHSEGAGDLGGLAIHRHTDNSNFGGHLLFFRSDGDHSTPGTVDDNDTLGRMLGLGFDGTDYEAAAEIRFVADGTPGNNDMPGEIQFYTNAGSQTLTQAGAFRADQTFETVGNINMAASTDLQVAGTAILSDSAGTMTLSNVDAIDATTETTLEAAIDTLSNLTTVGALDAGSITSNFGAIDNGASAISTTGTISGASGTWDAGGMDIAASDSYAVAGTDILSDSAGTMTLSNIDAIDATTETTIEAAIDTLSNLTTTGALDAGSITSNFGTINNGASTITTTGAVATGALSVTGDSDFTGEILIDETPTALFTAINLATGTFTHGAYATFGIEFTGTHNLDGNIAFPTGIIDNSIYNYDAGNAFNLGPRFFQFNSSITLKLNGITINTVPFYDSPKISIDGSGVTATSTYTGFTSVPNLSVANGGAFSASSTVVGFASFAAMASGTMANRFGLQIIDGSGAGSITNQWGVYIADLTKGGSANYGIYQVGDTDWSTGGAIIVRERTTAGPGLTQDADASMYVKANKFIIQWDDGGTTKYRYLDLTSTDALWTYTTSAP